MTVRNGKPVSGALAGVRVLVVEDQNDTRETIVASLRLWGAKVRAASSAAEARAVLARCRPDVIVSDIGMPGEDGYAFIQRLRAAEGGSARLPAVALTAHSTPDDRVRARAAGFDRLLPKPMQIEELVFALAAFTVRSKSSES